MDKKRSTKLFNKKAWGEIVSASVTAVSVILDATGVAEDIPFQYLALIGFCVFSILVYNRMGKYIEKNDLFENARPLIIPESPRVVEHDVYRRQLDTEEVVNTTTTTTTTIFHRVVSEEKKERYGFVVVDFRNSPIESTEFSVAKDVAAWITYYKDGSITPLINDIPGRWWNKHELNLGEDPAELERIDINPNRQKVTLALAFKGKNERVLYAYNNDSHKAGAKEFRRPEFLLGSGKYRVKVVLAGVHLKDSEYEFFISVGENGINAT